MVSWQMERGCPSRLKRRSVGILLMLVALLAGQVGTTATATAAPDSAFWAAEWAIVGPQASGGGTLSGLQYGATGKGLVLSAGAGVGALVSAVHDMGHEFMALGVLWQAQTQAGEVTLEVRSSLDGETWEPWQAVVADDTAPDGAPTDVKHSELVVGTGRYVQLRASLRGAGPSAASLQMLKLVAIDARPGPQAKPVAAAEAGPTIISRASWGANEAWMTWPPEYAPVSKFVIHHTVTRNNDTDPAATMRAIYYYHAVTLNWGDIGYNYVIDQQGRIYEGRAGGDGVIGGHARPYNTGTVGVAILGDYSSTDVPAAAVSALVELLAWKGNLHFIDPLGSGWLRDRVFPNIMGHRDCSNTACPGDRAYALLPQIRSSVAQRMQAIPPHLVVYKPATNELMAGVHEVTWQASPAVTRVTLVVDGQARASVDASTTRWPWNTTTEGDGIHHLRVTASTSQGQNTTVELAVQIDNTAPTGSLSAPAFTNAQSVPLTLTCKDCSRIQLGAGWRWEGESLYHAAGTGQAVADSAAANGQAWVGRAGVDSAGPWYGPYFCGLPSPGDYEAVFWLRSGRTDLSAVEAELDVADQAGTRLLAGPLPIAGTDFAATGRYQSFRLPFHYPDPGTSCRGVPGDGLELRTWFKATGDLWLDRVEIFRAPQPFLSSVSYALPAAEGHYPIEVRFLDGAGNASPVYAQTVTVDRTPPQCSAFTAEGVPVADALAGLDPAGAAYALSEDGMSWGAWVSTPMTVGPDGLAGLVSPQPSWQGYSVRVRVYDRAGNVAVSQPTSWPLLGPAPTPAGPPLVYTNRAYCPLAER